MRLPCSGGAKRSPAKRSFSGVFADAPLTVTEELQVEHRGGALPAPAPRIAESRRLTEKRKTRRGGLGQRSLRGGRFGEYGQEEFGVFQADIIGC